MAADIHVGDKVKLVTDGAVGWVRRIVGDEALVDFGETEHYVSLSDLRPFGRLPHERLRDGFVGDSDAAYLRLLATLVDHTYRYEPGSPLTNARLEPKLHQVFVAHRIVAQKIAPRMILADEVGLGKTIEAGLVIKELKARNAVERVLVVCPASLTRQWQSELRSKFNERFEIMDGAAAKHYGRSGANPFAATRDVICSLPFAQSDARADQIVEAGWDLVIFDEAHRVRRTRSGQNDRTTRAYRLADRLRDEIHGMLLLSATPMQLHHFELYSLIELIEPGLFPNFESFDRAHHAIPALNELMRAVDRWPALPAHDRAALLGKHAALVHGIPDLQGAGPETPEARESAKDALVKAHPLADVLVRNRKRELGLAGERRATLVTVTPSIVEREIYDEVEDYIRDTYVEATAAKNRTVGFLMVIYQKMLTSSSHALRTSFRRRMAKLRDELAHPTARRARGGELTEADDPDELSALAQDVDGAALRTERLRWEIETLERLVDRLDAVRDTKIARLVDIVADMSSAGRKAVIFTQFVETQLFLAAALDANGYKAAVFNGRQSADEKEHAIRTFRDHADVLVSTEAGGEGRNLQFASVLVNYDLPWNPMKVEQRIGRLDRIGQTHPVEIYNLVYAGTLEERIVEVLTDRIRLFEESVGALDPILGNFERDLEDLVMNPESSAFDRDFTRFADDLEREVNEARLKEEKLADFVLDRASFRSDEANRLLGRTSVAGPGDLEEVVTLGLEYLGGSVSEHPDGGALITLSPRLAMRLGVQRQNHRGVFDPAEAARLDDLDFFACGHDLIDRILDAMRKLPDAEVGARLSSETPPGTWVEVLWRVRAELGVAEGKILRHLVGPDGAVHSSQLVAMPLRDQPVRTDAPPWAADAVEASRHHFDTDRAVWRDRYRLRFEALQEGRLQRLERLFASRRDRLMLQIAQQEEWLRLRSGPDARAEDRRILPARRAQLERTRERLLTLDEEYAQQRLAEESRRLDFRGEVIMAAVVLGR